MKGNSWGRSLSPEKPVKNPKKTCYWQDRDTEDAGEMEQPAGFQMLMFGVPHLSDCDLCSRLPLTITIFSVRVPAIIVSW